nr:hypothetical protein [Rickettsia endosymbiont of Ceutorhynchus assimilis]
MPNLLNSRIFSLDRVFPRLHSCLSLTITGSGNKSTTPTDNTLAIIYSTFNWNRNIPIFHNWLLLEYANPILLANSA